MRYFVILSLVLSAALPALAQDISATREIINYEEINGNIYYSYKGERAGNRNIISGTRESLSPTQYRIYSQSKFIKEGGTWFTIERDISPVDTFVRPSAPISAYFISYAKAESIPTEGINGYTYGYDASYATARSTANSVSNTPTLYLGAFYNEATYYVVRRGFSFDVTGLTVASSTLYARRGDILQNADSDSLALVEFTPASWTTLALGDHANFSTTEVASRKTYASIPGTSGAWFHMPITDISSFDGVFGLGLRSAKDIDNSAPSGLTRVDIVEVYLEIETEGSEPTPPGATSTTTAADYERLSTFALTGAVSLLFFLTGFGLVIFIYKML